MFHVNINSLNKLRHVKVGLFLSLLIFLNFSDCFIASSQVLRNEGKINVSGGYLVISGNYQSESAGSITLDGVITISGNWTNNGLTNVIDNPGTNGEVIFNGSSIQTIGGSSDVCDFEKITINSGSTLQVAEGKGVTAYGTCSFSTPLILKSSNTSFRPIMATFINKSIVSGDITMELSYTSTGSSAAGTGRGLYFSSPINNATSTIFNVAAGSNLLWYQDEVNRVYKKVTTNGTTLAIAKGYILRAPTTQVFSFTGAPNTSSSYGNSNIPRAVAGQYYLFGNPYPSVVDWQTISTKTNLSNTIWYQTSTTSGSMVVDTWNGNSMVGTNNNGTAPVDGKIPPMQSFWVQCSSVGMVGNLTINDSDRTHNWGSSTFLKSPSQVASNTDLFRLYLYTGEKRDEAIILQSDLAQDSYEDRDSKKMLLKDGVRAEVYTLSSDRVNLVIQSVKPILSSKDVHIGISVGAAGEYRFSTNSESLSNSYNVFLEDKQLSVTQDLVAKPEYHFSSNAVDDTSRFVIHLIAAPKIVINNPMTVCSPQTIDLTSEAVTFGSDANLTFTYWLDSQATIPYTTPASSESGAYYIKGTSISGAYTIVGPVNVTINPTPTVVTNNPAAVTEPATVDLTSSEITFGSTEGLSYSYWLDVVATIPYATPQFATQGDYYIKGTVETTGCFSIAGPVTVVINANTTDVADLNTDKLLIYASNNQLHILNSDLNAQVWVYDIMGTERYFGYIKSQNDIINCSFSPGIYIVKVQSGKEIKTQKVYI